MYTPYRRPTNTRGMAITAALTFALVGLGSITYALEHLLRGLGWLFFGAVFLFFAVIFFLAIIKTKE